MMRLTALARLAGCLGLGLLLVSCSSQAPKPTSKGVAGPGGYLRPHRDGAPWWDVDVSRIPDAVPMPYNGPLKNNPYTVLGKTYFPLTDSRNYRVTGTASWYGTKFHGQATANGETYDLYGMTAAHKTLPLPSYVRVTNLDNGRSVILRVNDRGPFYSDRVIDLSFAAAKKLGYAEIGTARVSVEGIDPQQYWAQRGQAVPMVLAQPRQAPVAQKTTETQTFGAIETYTPPVNQHAEPVTPAAVDAKKNVSAPAAGLYLQVAAFANPDAAELLKDKLSDLTGAPVFISSTVRNQQTLHRVRLGPVQPAEVPQLQNSVRVARLGQASLVQPD
ncbi:rare lipoprotein A [Pseudomonas sp. Snoq117.2]|nr:rare lipoprotein A [Pseudomonas sp. Snoq117.2]